MGIGGSIFLIALGAIIAFGVHVQVGWLDLAVVGWVFMVAGFVGLVLTVWYWSSRRRTVAVDERPVDGRVVGEAPPTIHTHRAADADVAVPAPDWAQPRDGRY